MSIGGVYREILKDRIGGMMWCIEGVRIKIVGVVMERVGKIIFR